MSTLILVPWAATDWTASHRLPGATALPLNDDGIAQAKAWAVELASIGPRFVFTSDERTSQETALPIARSTDAETRTIKTLREVDFGLWAGLTEERVRERFPRVYKRWLDDPAAVDPPAGEPIGKVTERLRKALRAAASKAGRRSYAVVLGPTACALAEGIIHDQPPRSRRISEPVIVDLLAVGETTRPASTELGGGGGATDE